MKGQAKPTQFANAHCILKFDKKKQMFILE